MSESLPDGMPDDPDDWPDGEEEAPANDNHEPEQGTICDARQADLWAP